MRQYGMRQYTVTYRTWTKNGHGNLIDDILQVTLPMEDPRVDDYKVTYDLRTEGLWITVGSTLVWTPPHQIISVVFFDA